MYRIAYLLSFFLTDLSNSTGTAAFVWDLSVVGGTTTELVTLTTALFEKCCMLLLV